MNMVECIDIEDYVAEVVALAKKRDVDINVDLARGMLTYQHASVWACPNATKVVIEMTVEDTRTDL